MFNLTDERHFFQFNLQPLPSIESAKLVQTYCLRKFTLAEFGLSDLEDDEGEEMDDEEALLNLCECP